MKYPVWLRVLLVLMLVLVFSGLVIGNYKFVLQSPGWTDFLPGWNGCRSWVVDKISPYDPSVALNAQEKIYGRPANLEEGEEEGRFLYPLPAAIFFAPFCMLPYPFALALWMALLEVGLLTLTLIGIQLAHWKPRGSILGMILIFSVVWYHGFRAIVLSEFSVVIGLLMAGALLAVQRHKDIFAGILLALSLAKPQMSILLILFILLWAISCKRWSLVLSTLGFILAIITISIAIMPDWPLDWIRQLAGFIRQTLETSRPPIMLLGNIIPSAAKEIGFGLIGLLVLYLMYEWVLAKGKDGIWIQWTAALTIVVTNLIAYPPNSSNYVAMLPALCLIFAIWSERWGHEGRVRVIIAVILLFAALWGLYLITFSGNQETTIMLLPIPLLTLIGLWWVRWWVMRPVRLQPEKFQLPDV